MTRKKRASKRVPVGGNRLKLNVPEHLKNPEFVYRWVNDTGVNMQRYLDAGYEVVEDENMEVGEGSVESTRLPGKAVTKSVGRTREESNTVAVLMRIHKDY